jgi:hypothetical protein
MIDAMGVLASPCAVAADVWLGGILVNRGRLPHIVAARSRRPDRARSLAAAIFTSAVMAEPVGTSQH